MRAAEVQALADLGTGAATGVADQARDLHRAIAGRVFGALGVARLPVAGLARLHDALAAGSHGVARGLVGTVGRATGGLGTRLASGDRLDADPRGRVVIGVLAGAWGDRLAARGSPLAPELALLVDGRWPVGDRVAVFVHGLGESELAWRTPGYGELLAQRHGITPVVARYNSGCSIAASGRGLDDGLATLVAGWPIPITELTLIGHSMGGLVIRAACESDHADRWRGRVRATVGLGVPHAGAPLARAAARAESLLSALPETRPFAAVLRARSAGIRDLQHGLDGPFLPGCDHYMISATVTRDPGALAGRALGDLLVRHRSAWAQRTSTERLRFSPDHYHRLGGLTHFDLLGHPSVGEPLCDWLGAPRAV